MFWWWGEEAVASTPLSVLNLCSLRFLLPNNEDRWCDTTAEHVAALVPKRVAAIPLAFVLLVPFSQGVGGGVPLSFKHSSMRFVL